MNGADTDDDDDCGLSFIHNVEMIADNQQGGSACLLQQGEPARDLFNQDHQGDQERYHHALPLQQRESADQLEPPPQCQPSQREPASSPYLEFRI